MPKLTVVDPSVETTNIDDVVAPQQVMLDLETWGTGNKAVIISIGAVRFDETELYDRFHVAIEPASCMRVGLEVDAGALLWWLSPELDEPRKAWLNLERTDLASALDGFALWLGAPPIAALWGNGSTFDNIILRSAYEAVGMEYPVRYRQDACYRTLKYRAPDIKLVREGTHHSALDDAISQAKHLQEIVAATGIKL